MTIAEYFILGLFVLLGLISLVASLFHLDWFFQTGSARGIIQWLGRPGARIFYGLLGIALILCGILGYLQWNHS